MPRYPVATLPNPSIAVTVKLCERRRSSWIGNPATVKRWRRRRRRSLRAAGDQAIHGIRGVERLSPHGLERDGKGVRPVVRRGKGVVRRKDGLAVAAGEVNRSEVAVGNVPELVAGGDGEVERGAGRGICRHAAEGEVLGHAAGDDLAESTGGGPLEAGRPGVGRGDRVRAYAEMVMVAPP